MWYLAGGSLNQYIKMRIEADGQAITSHQVNVELVDLHMYEGTGKFTNIVLKDTLKVAEISVQFDVKSLNENPIIIDSVIINNPELIQKNSALTENTLLNLTQAIQANRQKMQFKIEQATEQLEPHFLVKKVVIKYSDDKNHQQLSTYDSANDKEGYSLSLVAADTLLQLLEAINSNTSVAVESNN